MKVSILIEPDGDDAGWTTTISGEEVLTMRELLNLYVQAAKGAGWRVEDMAAYCGENEFWSNT